MPRIAPGLPFAALNLRRNPFGAPGDDAGAVRVDVDDAVAFLRSGPSEVGRRPGPPRTVQFVGPGGSGKSTHLRTLARRIAGATIWAWSRTEGWPPPPPSSGPLLVDDAQELSEAVLARLARTPRLALATRRDRSHELERGGAVVATRRLGAPPTPERLARVVAARLESARRGPGPLPDPGARRLGRLRERHGGDWRAILGDLYDWLQAEAARARAAS